MGPNKDSESTVDGTPDLWQDAYVALESDPRSKNLLTKLHRVILDQQQPHGKTIAHLHTASGRKALLEVITQKVTQIQSQRTNPKIDKVCSVMMKARDMVAMGAAASPPATVAVAGLFIAFSIRQMYTSESSAMFETAFKVVKVVVRCSVEDKQVCSKAGVKESPNLQDLRKSLRESYVELYQLILYLTAKLVVKLDSPLRVLDNLLGLSDWPAEAAKLAEAENDITKDLNSIHRFHADGMPQQPGWMRKGRNELHQAVSYNLQDKVFDIIQKGQIDVNARTAAGWTALSLAAEKGYMKIVAMLLAVKGVDLNSCNNNGKTALHVAALQNQVQTVRMLVSTGAEVDVRDKNGRPAFIDAAGLGFFEVIKILRGGRRGDGIGGAKINQRTAANGWTALHEAVSQDQVETSRWLVQQGIDKNIKISGGTRKGLTAKELAQGLGNTRLFTDAGILL